MRSLTLNKIQYVSGGYLAGSTPIPEIIFVWGRRVRTSDRPSGGGGGSLFSGPPDQSERGANDDVPGPLEWWNSMSEAQRSKIIGRLMGVGAGIAIVALTTFAGSVAIPAAIAAIVAGTATTAQVTAVAMVALGVIASASGAISLVGDLS